jgi:hypothetical protein
MKAVTRDVGRAKNGKGRRASRQAAFMVAGARNTLYLEFCWAAA